MAVIHFKNFAMLDPELGELRGGHELIVEGDTIKEVSAKPIKFENADVIDCGGRTLMPGLIDSHVHVVLSEVVIRNLESVPLTLMTARAAELMRRMLERGFTSVRDTGGADWGLKEATDKWLLPGPRLFIAGRAIGPTGLVYGQSRPRNPNATPPKPAGLLGEALCFNFALDCRKVFKYPQPRKRTGALSDER